MRLRYALAAAICISAIPSVVVAKPFKVDVCNDAYTKAHAELESQYDSGITELDKLITALIKAGANPHKYPWPQPDGSFQVVDVYLLKTKVQSQRIVDSKALFADVKKSCSTMTVVQDVVDKATSLAALGMALPARAMHIDVSEIIVNGKPLGGDNALIPKLREQVLRGDRGEISQIVRNPVARPAQIVRSWAHHLGFKHF